MESVKAAFTYPFGSVYEYDYPITESERGCHLTNRNKDNCTSLEQITRKMLVSC